MQYFYNSLHKSDMYPKYLFHIQIADDQRCAVLEEKYDPTTKSCWCGSKNTCTYSGMW